MIYFVYSTSIINNWRHYALFILYLFLRGSTFISHSRLVVLKTRTTYSIPFYFAFPGPSSDNKTPLSPDTSFSSSREIPQLALTLELPLGDQPLFLLSKGSPNTSAEIQYVLFEIFWSWLTAEGSNADRSVELYLCRMVHWPHCGRRCIDPFSKLLFSSSLSCEQHPRYLNSSPWDRNFPPTCCSNCPGTWTF